MSSWLEYRAQKTGKSVEELRAEMASRGAIKSPKKGFGSMGKEKASEAGRKGGIATAQRKLKQEGA